MGVSPALGRLARRLFTIITVTTPITLIDDPPPSS
jgi:hypothetical protein